MNKTINDAVIEILRQSKAPLAPDEIVKRILSNKLYNFNSPSPKNIVQTQLRRFSENVPLKTSSTKKLYVFEKGKYRLK